MNITAIVPTVTPMADMSTGAQITNASIGAMLLITGGFLTHSAVSARKKTLFPYTLEETALVTTGRAVKEVHGLLAIISFVMFGWSGTALLLSGPGMLGDVTRWLQDTVSSWSQQNILSDIGAPGISLILLMLALSARTDHRADFLLGSLAGVIWPLGGGPWLESSRGVGQLGVTVYGWLENLASWVAGLSPVMIILFVLGCLAFSYVWREHLSGMVQSRVSK
jgi:hypothetical protein